MNHRFVCLPKLFILLSLSLSAILCPKIKCTKKLQWKERLKVRDVKEVKGRLRARSNLTLIWKWKFDEILLKVVSKTSKLHLKKGNKSVNESLKRWMKVEDDVVKGVKESVVKCTHLWSVVQFNVNIENCDT